MIKVWPCALRAAAAAALLAMLLAMASSHALAQPFPSKPITMVVPFAAGGGTDSLARDLARSLERDLGKAVIIDNKGGAGGAVGALAVAKAAPDGYTLLFVTSTFVSHAATDPTVTYDVRKDFAPIAMLGSGPLMLVVSQQSGIASVAQLIARARQEPGVLAYCSAGPGSINHVSAEWFSQQAGVAMTHIPYRGSGPALIDLLAGRTQVFFATVPTIGAHVKEGKVRLLAMTSPQRSPLYPDVPTVIESGVTGYQVATWWGIVAPAGTPAAVVRRLQAAIAASAPAVRERLIEEGAQPQLRGPVEFAQLIDSEFTQWSRLAKPAR
jgi:tripartite-type tricarboxylate transporter receptor subunit TctC